MSSGPMNKKGNRKVPLGILSGVVIIGLSILSFDAMYLTVRSWAGTGEDVKDASGSPDGAYQSPASLAPKGFFLPNFRISDARKRSHWAHTFSSGAHSIAVHGKEVYAVWYDVRNQNSDVFFAKSVDSGGSFGKNIRMNDDHGNARQYKPTLGVDRSGTIYALWRDDRRGHADIFFSRSNNEGKSFSRNRRLNDDQGWAYQGNPSIGVSPDGSVYAAWSDSRNDQDDIYFTASRDGGKSFSRNRRLNDDSDENKTVQSHPTVGAGVKGLVVVAWEDFRSGSAEIYTTRSTDGGKTFEPNRKLTPLSGRGQQISPSIAVNPEGWVAVAWAEFVPQTVKLTPPNAAKGETLWWDRVRHDDADIFVTVSRDGGKSFSNPVRINDDSAGHVQAFPSVAIGPGGRLYLAWEDFRNGQPDIYYGSVDETVSLSPNRKVNDDSTGAGQNHPSVAVDGQGKAYLVWTDSRGNTFADVDEEDEQGNQVYFSRGN